MTIPKNKAFEMGVANYHALMARGVKHFPVPTCEATDVNLSSENNFKQNVEHPKKCLGCSNAPTHWDWPEKKFQHVVILETTEEKEVQLIRQLFQKLNRTVYLTSAVKCQLQEALLKDQAQKCFQEVLLQELQIVQPQKIYCFGFRSWLPLMAIQAHLVWEEYGVYDMPLQNAAAKENGLIPPKVTCLPSALELLSRPLWRKTVWKVLQKD